MRARDVLAVAIVAACGGSHGAAPPAGEGSAKMLAMEPTPIVVTDAAGAQANAGKRVRVRGTARDAKLGAAIVTGDLVVYCTGVDPWPAEVAGTPVTAYGVLAQTTRFATPDPTSAGTAGAVWELRECTWEP